MAGLIPEKERSGAEGTNWGMDSGLRLPAAVQLQYICIGPFPYITDSLKGSKEVSIPVLFVSLPAASYACC
jgi:hypothetical protein